MGNTRQLLIYFKLYFIWTKDNRFLDNFSVPSALAGRGRHRSQKDIHSHGSVQLCIIGTVPVTARLLHQDLRAKGHRQTHLCSRHQSVTRRCRQCTQRLRSPYRQCFFHFRLSFVNWSHTSAKPLKVAVASLIFVL